MSTWMIYVGGRSAPPVHRILQSNRRATDMIRMSQLRGIVNVNRVSSDVELTASSPPCAFAIWEAM
jgi:hypothetical protein